MREDSLYVERTMLVTDLPVSVLLRIEDSRR